MLLGTAFYPGDSFRSGRTGEQEWGAESGLCVLSFTHEGWECGMGDGVEIVEELI